MLNYFEGFGILAGALSFVGFLLYSRSIVLGNIQPNRATWIILTIVGLVLALSYYASGARETMWVPVSYVLGPLVVMILSIKYGEGGWSRLDRISFVGAALSLVLWWVSGKAAVALAMNIAIDFFGILPTIVKSYQRPDGEDSVVWGIDVIASGINLLAVKNPTFAILVYPMYMVVMNIVVVAALLVGMTKKDVSVYGNG
jgi:hypothetical protein